MAGLLGNGGPQTGGLVNATNPEILNAPMQQKGQRNFGGMMGDNRGVDMLDVALNRNHLIKVHEIKEWLKGGPKDQMIREFADWIEHGEYDWPEPEDKEAWRSALVDAVSGEENVPPWIPSEAVEFRKYEKEQAERLRQLDRETGADRI